MGAAASIELPTTVQQAKDAGFTREQIKQYMSDNTRRCSSPLLGGRAERSDDSPPPLMRARSFAAAMVDSREEWEKDLDGTASGLQEARAAAFAAGVRTSPVGKSAERRMQGSREASREDKQMRASFQAPVRIEEPWMR